MTPLRRSLLPVENSCCGPWECSRSLRVKWKWQEGRKLFLLRKIQSLRSDDGSAKGWIRHQAETGADQGKSDNESTENMSALSEITDPRVDRKETKKFMLYLFRHTLCS